MAKVKESKNDDGSITTVFKLNRKELKRLNDTVSCPYIPRPSFIYQPERSKREDSDEKIVRKSLSHVAKMPHRWKTKEEYDLDHKRCGALNIVETQ